MELIEDRYLKVNIKRSLFLKINNAYLKVDGI